MDYRANPALGMCFSDYNQDHTRAEVRARALTALRNCMQGATEDIDGRIWALIDLSGHSVRVMAACSFRIAAPICERLSKIPVAVMSDVLAAMDLPDQVVASSLRPLDTGIGTLAGPALCLRGEEGPEQPAAAGQPKPVYEMDRRIAKGCVAVIATGGHQVGAVIGGNVGLSWKRRGCAGVVTDGGIRDAAEFVDMELPVFTTFTTPISTKGRWGFTAIDAPVDLPGQSGRPVRVHPGDLVHADRDGAVVIPRAHASQAVADAEIFEAVEKRIQAELETGDDREAVYGRNDRLGHIRKVAP